MTIAIYILKSILCMTILVSFYKAFLESEKMHHFNRIFLLGSIVFSMTVCFMPTGFEFRPAMMSEVIISESLNPVSEGLTIVTASDSFSWESALMLLYFVGVLFFALKFVRNITLLLRNAFTNPTIKYKESTLVLLNENVSPFTFLNYIFICRKKYEMGNIDERLLEHELTHVRQKHSLDILFIELVKVAFWFNPLIWIYKKVIQLNHEFLADEAVISEHPQVSEYQSLLLDTIINNKVFLASNINFQLTKKRLSMMTKTSSTTRKRVLRLGIVPICLFMIFAFGKQVEAQKVSPKDKTYNTMAPDKDRYFEHSIVHYKTADGSTKVTSYKSLPETVRDQIPLPPPPPPAKESAMNTGKADALTMNPLPKGTIVYLYENGVIKIGNGEKGISPPPPPPVAPKIPPAPPKPPAPTADQMPPSPPVPATGKMPPPPPPPVTVEQIFEEGGTAYIDERKATKEQVMALMDQDELMQKQNKLIERIDVKRVNGKSELHIFKKQ